MIAKIERIVAPRFAIFGKKRRGCPTNSSGIPVGWKQWTDIQGQFPAPRFMPPIAIRDTAAAYHVEISARQHGAITAYPLGQGFVVNMLYPRDLGSKTFPVPLGVGTTERREHCEQITLVFDMHIWEAHCAELYPMVIAWMHEARIHLDRADIAHCPPRFVLRDNFDATTAMPDANMRRISQCLKGGNRVLAGRNSLAPNKPEVISRILGSLPPAARRAFSFSVGYARNDPAFAFQLFLDRTLTGNDDIQEGGLRLLCNDQGSLGRPRMRTLSGSNSASLIALAHECDLAYSAESELEERRKLENSFLDAFEEALDRDLLLDFALWKAIANLLHVPQMLSSIFRIGCHSRKAHLMACNMKMLDAVGVLDQNEFSGLCMQITPMHDWTSNSWDKFLKDNHFKDAVLTILSRNAREEIAIGLKPVDAMRVAAALVGKSRLAGKPQDLLQVEDHWGQVLNFRQR